MRYVFNFDEDIKILVVDKLTYAANKNNLKGVTYEFINKDISNNTISIENIESTKLIKLEKYNEKNDKNDNYTDYLLL